MVSGKKRLYIALYPSGVSNKEERRYHWAFLVGPKNEGAANVQVPGTKYHVKNRPVQGWIYEEVDVADVKSTVDLLARVTIAKVEDEDRLAGIMRKIPVVQNDPNWRCRSWIADVLSRLKEDGKAVGTSELDWPTIEALARDYVGKKAAAQRYAKVEELTLPKPMWNILEGKEVIP
ncbi:hypothetical protein SEUCBS140593_000948 [Sporothrix eucalyptigena]|uniref:Uncharacterized protein n=1 Tax=Sporothrix eucalyptigena TaxID=1812306 RepID=A0ABP0AUF3_9PEZI